MKKYMVVFALAAACLWAVQAMASAPPVPTEPIKMALTSKPVMFNHAVHQARQCGECHHVVNGAENYQKCSTAGCHDVLDRQDKTTHSYFRVIHNKGLQFSSCISCHTDVVKELPDRKKELTACAGSLCHAK